MVGAMVGLASWQCSKGEYVCGESALIGMFAGLAVASAVDAALFSWDAPTVGPPEALQFGIAPALSLDGKRAELRAFGTF